MPEPVDAPPWLAAAIAAFGQPWLACPTDIDMAWAGTKRRCWGWDVDGRNFDIAIDTYADGIKTAANSPGRRAQLTGPDEPTDADMQAMCAYAWPGYVPDGGHDA